MNHLMKGKLNIGPLDAFWGSSAKGKMADFIATKEGLDFAISQNSVNASHITVFDDGSSYKFRHLPSSVSVGKNLMVIIGCDATIDVPSFMQEMKDWDRNPRNTFIHPNALVITEKNVEYEEKNLGGIGSTMTGNGAARAMKVLRHKDVVTADMVPELKPYIYNTNSLVIKWLRSGMTGLLETAQGFDLSMDVVFDSNDECEFGKFYPMCTSRNINPEYFAGLSFVPHRFIGNVILNIRTYPIRVGDSSTANGDVTVKFVDGSEESFSPSLNSKVNVIVGTKEMSFVDSDNFIELFKELDDENSVYNKTVSSEENGNNKVTINGKEVRCLINLGSSGGCYPDQVECDWNTITESSDSKIPIMEMTSLTKRIRRVFYPSVMQLQNSTMSCMPTHITINFVNYLDANIYGENGKMSMDQLLEKYPKVHNFVKWVQDNQYWVGTKYEAKISLLGTGPMRSQVIEII